MDGTGCIGGNAWVKNGYYTPDLTVLLRIRQHYPWLGSEPIEGPWLRSNRLFLDRRQSCCDAIPTSRPRGDANYSRFLCRPTNGPALTEKASDDGVHEVLTRWGHSKIP
jgi:hypothetical protein